MCKDSESCLFSCLECYDNNKEGTRYERKDTLSVGFHLCNRIISIFASHNDHLYLYQSIRDIDYCGGCVIDLWRKTHTLACGMKATFHLINTKKNDI